MIRVLSFVIALLATSATADISICIKGTGVTISSSEKVSIIGGTNGRHFSGIITLNHQMCGFSSTETEGCRGFNIKIVKNCGETSYPSQCTGTLNESNDGATFALDC